MNDKSLYFTGAEKLCPKSDFLPEFRLMMRTRDQHRSEVQGALALYKQRHAYYRRLAQKEPDRRRKRILTQRSRRYMERVRAQRRKVRP